MQRRQLVGALQFRLPREDGIKHNHVARSLSKRRQQASVRIPARLAKPSVAWMFEDLLQHRFYTTTQQQQHKSALPSTSSHQHQHHLAHPPFSFVGTFHRNTPVLHATASVSPVNLPHSMLPMSICLGCSSTRASHDALSTWYSATTPSS